jgi:hypothetical protein
MIVSNPGVLTHCYYSYFTRFNFTHLTCVKKMNSLNRYFLIAVFFQIGCLALDHSISELEYEDELSILVPGSSFPTDSAL